MLMLEFKDSEGYVWYFNHLISATVLFVTFTWACKQQFIGQKDKLLHYVVSSAITIILIKILCFLNFNEFWWISPIIAISIGIGKEIYDFFNPKKHKCDFMDFVADFLGVATVSIVYLCSWVLYVEL